MKIRLANKLKNWINEGKFQRKKNPILSGRRVRIIDFTSCISCYLYFSISSWNVVSWPIYLSTRNVVLEGTILWGCREFSEKENIWALNTFFGRFQRLINVRKRIKWNLLSIVSRVHSVITFSSKFHSNLDTFLSHSDIKKAKWELNSR